MTTEEKLKIAQEAIAKIGDINEPVETRKPREWDVLVVPMHNQFGIKETITDTQLLNITPKQKVITVREVLEPSEPKCEGVKSDE